MLPDYKSLNISHKHVSFSSDNETMYDDKGRDESDKYKDQGVEDEEGLKKIVESGDEDDDDDEKKEDENEEDEENRIKEAKGWVIN